MGQKIIGGLYLRIKIWENCSVRSMPGGVNRHCIDIAGRLRTFRWTLSTCVSMNNSYNTQLKSIGHCPGQCPVIERILLPSWEVHFGLHLMVDHRRIIEDLARIHALAGVIRGIPIPPSAQERLDRLNILRAVQGTTGIEGTELSVEEVGLIMDSPPGSPALGPGREREEQEAKNAETLMGYVSEYVERNPSEPISETSILKFHEILTRGINYPYNEPGRYPQSLSSCRRLPASREWGRSAGVDDRFHPMVQHRGAGIVGSSPEGDSGPFLCG